MLGPVKRRILQLLRDEGPMGHYQIAERLSLTVKDIQGPIKSLAWGGYIVKYRNDRKHYNIWAFKTFP